jgi:hypothetical protein
MDVILEGWYTLAQVSRRLHVSRQRVHQILQAERLQPATMLGRQVLSEAQLQHLLRRTPGRPGRKPTAQS